MVKQKRDGKIEMMRFYAIITIMCGHFRVIGLSDLERPFAKTWIFVEFFFIISGFFAAKVFDGRENGKTDPALAVKYTLTKFKRYLPYVICAVALEYALRYTYLLQSGAFHKWMSSIDDMPFEMMMLSAANTNGTKAFALWFLSASFIVFPFVCLIAQQKNKYVRLILAFYPALIYYFFRKQSIGEHAYPNQLIRAFCGMMLGIVTYHLAGYLSSKQFSKRIKTCFSVLLIAIYAVLLGMGYLNWVLTGTYLLCFILAVSLTFGNVTLLPSCSNRLVLYLGELSMPMYIWHQPLGHLINTIWPDGGTAFKIIAYYGVTIAVSLISLLIVKWVRKRIQRRRETGAAPAA